MDKAGNLFGNSRVRLLIEANATLPLTDLQAKIMDAVRSHGAPPDDQTLLLARVR